MALHPLTGGRLMVVIRPPVAVARACYLTAYANLCLSTAPERKQVWANCMGFLTPDLATTEAARVAFLSRLPGAVIAPGQH